MHLHLAFMHWYHNNMNPHGAHTLLEFCHMSEIWGSISNQVLSKRGRRERGWMKDLFEVIHNLVIWSSSPSICPPWCMQMVKYGGARCCGEKSHDDPSICPPWCMRVAKYGGARCCGEKSHNDIRLRSTYSDSRWGFERHPWTPISGWPLCTRLWPHHWL